eukprot:540839_1
MADDATAIWLKQNKLDHLITKFKEVRLEIDELIDLTNEDDEFLNSLIASNTINATDKIRIKRAVKKMNKSQNSDREKMKVITVVVSDQEESAINKLNEQKQKVTALMDRLKQNQNDVNGNTEKCKMEIDTKFNNLFTAFEQEKQKIIKGLYSISKQKSAEIGALSEALQSTMTKFNTTLDSCNKLITDCHMDRFERKQKILSLCKEAVTQPISDDSGINTQIIFKFNDDAMATCLSSLCSIYDREGHPLPVITNVTTESIGTDTSTISWKAKLLDKDVNKAVHSKLFMKLHCLNDDLDEKEKGILDSPLIEFDQNKTQYKYVCDKLKENSQYKMGLKIFESISLQCDPRQSQPRNDFKLINIGFTTLSYSSQTQWKWIAETKPNRNYQCYYDVLNGGKTLKKARNFGTIDIVRMNPWISKNSTSGKIYKLYLRVDELTGVDGSYGFGVITKKRWTTDDNWSLGYAPGSYFWRFKGGVFQGNDSKIPNMSAISSAGQMIGLEINFRNNNVTFQLFKDTNLKNCIDTASGTFDELQNEEVCVAIAVRKSCTFTIVGN